MDVVLMRPHTIECTISKRHGHSLPPSFEDIALYCLSSMHISQSNKDVNKKIYQNLDVGCLLKKLQGQAMGLYTFRCTATTRLTKF